MKRIFFFFLSTFFAVSLSAQTIIDELQRDVPSAGVIRVNASPEINQLIGRKSASAFLEEYIKVSGFRVQVFAGNEQRTSKAEALKKQELINEMFPDVPTYVMYNAPYWRLRVGDFRSREEAFLLMKQITQDLPALKKESYIVKDEVRVSVDK